MQFVYVIYEGKLGVASKEKWNARGGYIPDDHEATEETFKFLQSISPKFNITSGGFFSFKGNKKLAVELLKSAGVIKVDFCQILE